MLLKSYGLRAAAAAAIFLISPEFASSANSRVAAIGPIEQVNCSAGTYQVLGIKFTAISRSMLSGVCGSQTSLGLAYVVATGLRSESGKTVGSELAEIQSDLYVPGATNVFVRGLVSRTKSATGEFEVAGTLVAALSGQVPTLGESVDIIGTQPLLGGVVIAEAVYPSSDAKTFSDPRVMRAIIGSGSSSKAIIGSGASSKAIIGSGSSSKAIIGSGASSKAIIGSGSSSKAIIGSGASSKAIIGSGSSSKAIIGSGASSKAIIGSGQSTDAIIGSGASSKAIIGSGSSSKAIIGSGASSKAIIGSGSSSKAIIGSGASTKAIIGSGASTSAISGSGASSLAIIGSGANQS